jgi:hypothetical protein
MRKPAGAAYQELVATMVKAFDPTADIKVGEWIEGPDGRIDMDVAIRGNLDGKPTLVVIECKDFDRTKTGRVGRPFIDALDSKRHDLGADAVLICNNSGFTRDALNKARRKGIGAISVLSEADPQVKVVIESEIYFRRVRFGERTYTYSGPDVTGLKIGLHELTYNGTAVDSWMESHVAAFLGANPSLSGQRLTGLYRLRQPTEFDFQNRKIILDRFSISLSPKIRWFARRVQLDANLAMYDYLRGKVRFGIGENQYLIRGIDFDKGTPLDAAPELEPVGLNLMSGELEVGLLLIEDVNIDKEISVSAVEQIIIPEDLALMAPKAPERA